MIFQEDACGTNQSHMPVRVNIGGHRTHLRVISGNQFLNNKVTAEANTPQKIPEVVEFLLTLDKPDLAFSFEFQGIVIITARGFCHHGESKRNLGTHWSLGRKITEGHHTRRRRRHSQLITELSKGALIRHAIDDVHRRKWECVMLAQSIPMTRNKFRMKIMICNKDQSAIHISIGEFPERCQKFLIGSMRDDRLNPTKGRT